MSINPREVRRAADPQPQSSFWPLPWPALVSVDILRVALPFGPWPTGHPLPFAPPGGERRKETLLRKASGPTAHVAGAGLHLEVDGGKRCRSAALPEGQSDPQDINRNEGWPRQWPERRLRLRVCGPPSLPLGLSTSWRAAPGKARGRALFAAAFKLAESAKNPTPFCDNNPPVFSLHFHIR